MDELNPYQSPSDQTPAAPPPVRPEPGSSLDFGRALSFFFQDPDWVKKLLLGSLFTLLAFLVVGAFFIAGYMIRVIRRSARGETYPLPDWDDLNGIFMDGLHAAGAYLAYLLPAVALYAIFAVAMAVMAGGDGDASAVVALFGMAVMGILMIVMLVLMLFLPAAMTRLALRGNIGAAFEFEAIFAYIKRNLTNYILAILVMILANFISQFGIILFCIGIIPASFWAATVMAYALGEVALRDPAPDVPPAVTG